MGSDYSLPPEQPGPQPHPYLHEPLLYISALPHFVKDEDLAIAFQQCAPFRPKIDRDAADTYRALSGTIEFKYLQKGAHSLFGFSALFLFSFHFRHSLPHEREP